MDTIEELQTTVEDLERRLAHVELEIARLQTRLHDLERDVQRCTYHVDFDS